MSRAGRERVLSAKAEILRTYRAGRGLRPLAREYDVSHPWLAARFDEWGEPRRSKEESDELNRDKWRGYHF